MRVAFIQKNDTITIYEGLDPTIVDEMEADGFLNGHNISIDFDDMFDYEPNNKGGVGLKSRRSALHRRTHRL